MSKTGLKTFVCSFVVTLSVVLGADRAFFCTPKVKNDELNIAYFFRGCLFENPSQKYIIIFQK